MTHIPEYLQPYLEKFPLQAGPLLTSIKDLSLSVGCHGGPQAERRPPSSSVALAAPYNITASFLRPSVLKSIFRELALIEVASLPEPIPPFAPTLDELREQLSQIQVPEDAEKAQEDDKGERERTQEGKPGEESEGFDRETIYMAIVTGDSTVVYYKLSKGIKKPADIPDE
ncbi:hypothetical protein D1P53_005415 [Cryptococcus gattii VGV]|nr:hypothetical protein D1P53_005415 [Cryptococcus gattii VGV]